MSGPSGEEVAAVLMRSLPPELAEKLLTRLDPERAARLRARMAAMTSSPTPQQLEQALSTFASMQQNASTNPPPSSTANKLDVTVSDKGVSGKTPSGDVQTPNEDEDESAQAVQKKKIKIRKPPKLEIPDEPESILVLRELEVDRLVQVLVDEQNTTIALVMSVLNMDTAAEIMKRLPADRRPEVALRLSQPGMKNRLLLDQLARAIIEKVKKYADSPPEASVDQRVSNLAIMLRGLPRPDRMQIMEVLEKSDPNTSERVKEQLYQFEDVLRIEDRGLQTVLVELDMKTLAVALKGAEDDVQKKISTNMSSRAREMLTEEISLLGSIPTSRVNEARTKVVGVLRKFEEEGKIVIET